MANTYTNLLDHIVFSTKNRRPLIRGDVQGNLYAYIVGIIRGENGALLEIGGMPDHLHLLASFKADTEVATMLRRIKANSSGWMNPTRRQDQVRLANGLCGLLGQRITGREGAAIHPEPAAASPAQDLPGGIGRAAAQA